MKDNTPQKQKGTTKDTKGNKETTEDKTNNM